MIFSIINPKQSYKSGDRLEIMLTDKNGKIENHVYTYQTMFDIQKILLKKRKLSLENCFIEDFVYSELYDINSESKPILQDCIVRDSIFIGKADFTKAVFNGSTTFSKVIFDCTSSFDDTIFKGITVFEDTIFNVSLSFRRSSFSQEVKLDRTEFNNSYFSDTVFQNTANFSRITFLRKTYFSSISFLGKAIFVSTIFRDDVSFYKTTFEDEVLFLGTSFGRDTTFNEVTFAKKTDFISINFGDLVLFSYTAFSEATTFAAICGNGYFLFEDCFFKNEIFFKHIEYLKALSFESCTNHVIIDMQNEPKKIEGLAFKNMNNLGHINLNWKAYKKSLQDYETIIVVETAKGEPVRKLIKSYDHYERQYMMLKENFHNLGDYDAEDETYVEYKRAQRKNQKGIRKAFSFLFDKIGRYGTDPIRVLITMLIVIFVFGLIYCGFLSDLSFSNEIKSVWLIEFVKESDLKDLILWLFKIKWEDLFCFIKNGGLLDILNMIIKPFYFSMVTFFTVGYGDIYPISTLTELLVCIESFCGVFLMSFFSVALVRKILR